MAEIIEPKVVVELKKIDLLTYLQVCEPNNLVRVGSNVYSTKEHDSMRISNGKWCWWSCGIGGCTALDYLIKVKGMSFLSAAHYLAAAFRNKTVAEMEFERQPKAHKELELPPRNANNYRVQSYLERRGIEPAIIEHCIKNGSLYESADYHNAVFIGFDKQGVPRYGFKRSTGSTRFVADCAGSSKQYSFRLDSQLGDRCQQVHLFESVIDALSFATLELLYRRSWQDENLLSLSGIYAPKSGKLPAALSQYLKDHPAVKALTLHLDNDEPGHAAAKAIAQLATKQGLRVTDSCPARKDVNEQLCLFRGLPLMHQSAPGKKR